MRVVVTRSARGDLDEIEEYWIARGEADRGEKYFNDPTDVAESQLGDMASAKRGRLYGAEHPGVREILAFGVYRIIYEIDETALCVNVLRFWHAHRDEPPLQ